MDWSAAFEASLPYAPFLDKFATPEQRARWDRMHATIKLSADQTALLAGFKRRLPVVVLNGAWCGDCVNQCPIFDHFAAASPALDLRFLDREALPEVRDALKVNGGNRVPVVVFLSEDFDEVARYGDRTISRYRQLAADQLGASCPTGIVPPSGEATAAVVGEWLDQFERAQLILRLSPRLRERHGD